MGLSALADKLGISVETSKTNIFGWYLAIFKTRNGELGNGNGNGEQGTGNGESLKAGIFKMGNL